MRGQDAVETFISRWAGREGGQERANYALFLIELCDVLGVDRPEAAGVTIRANDYVFERQVREYDRGGRPSWKRIDLYRRDCFVLEAKQSRAFADKAAPGQEDFFAREAVAREARGRRWDVLMVEARQQAENYVRLLPVDHRAPPFVLVCDVGRAIEVYANFRRDGKAYDQFPDRQNFRIELSDLRRPEIRARLTAIWSAPMSLDPARQAAKVTREIAGRLAVVEKAAEQAGHAPEQVAMFLMRVILTMFAEDVGLLPAESFRNLLAACEADPSKFANMLRILWGEMDRGGFSAVLGAEIPAFNGGFFRDPLALPLSREAIGELRRAAGCDWRGVEPAIFGALLEQALDPTERRRLGAHYTPRAYVERLVVATVIDPLRAQWELAKGTIEGLITDMEALGPRDPKRGRKLEAARQVAVAFHDQLCRIRVLDPACGTGNFLYVALELVKRLEGEVIEIVEALEGPENVRWLDRATVGPQQFLGLEINPRAAAIAELVVWIGFLQWHFRTQGGPPPQPILHDYRNIEERDAVLAWDGAPVPGFRDGSEVYPNPRRPQWPEAEFIVGNPPFIGGKDLRARLGDARAEALWAAHPQMNESADLVMYWWDRAAELLGRKDTKLRRFGFVTTNSISQLFQRRVMERHLHGSRPVSIVMAIPDHPWTRATRDAAAVRIAMTVVEAGRREGVLKQVVAEEGVDGDTPMIVFSDRVGRINADLTVGPDLGSAKALIANAGLSSRGMMLFGQAFLVRASEAEHLGLGRRSGLQNHIKPYRNGRDLTARPRGLLAIDLFGLDSEAVRTRFPEIYQHLLIHVKGERDRNRDPDMRARWWLFGRTRDEIRPALAGLPRYIATVETAKHRIFQFLDSDILPDNMLVAIASNSAFHLGVLSSRCHRIWALAQGATLEDRPRYSKSRCFDPFPFPVTDDLRRHRIGQIAEEIDAHRKRVLAEHAHLTLTGLYNALEQVETAETRVLKDGLVLILRELHDRLDAAVADAYGFEAGITEETMLERLVALNRERAAEEERGLVRWLRADYQQARFGRPGERGVQLQTEIAGVAEGSVKPAKPLFPKGAYDQTAAVMASLVNAAGPLGAAALASGFQQGRRVEPKIAAILGALARTGTALSSDRGRTFWLRRAA